MSRRATSIIGLVLVASGVPALGIEGRIPIFTQTTITDSGSYIVTQDISVAAGDGITITAGEVTLDLNGHTLSLPAGVGNGVFIGSGNDSFRITNGRIIGGDIGVRTDIAGVGALVVEDLEVATSSYGLYLWAQSVTVSRSTFLGNQVLVRGPSAASPVTARMVGNVFVGEDYTSLYLQYCQDSEIGGNRIMESGFRGILLANCPGSRIHDNLISYATVGTLDGVAIGVSSHGNQISDNVIHRFDIGIRADSSGNRISGNVIQQSGSAEGLYRGGIVIYGSRNLIEGNQIEGGASCGVSFQSGSANAYRGNMLRGNSLGGICGLSNTDAGGNIF